METPKKYDHNYIAEGCASLMSLVMGRELSIYQRGNARQELDKLLSDNKNALQQIEKLEAEKAELVEHCEINHFAPASEEFLLSKYKGLRELDEKRDEEYSALHDGIMNAIESNLFEHNKEQFHEVWSSSVFPERLTKEILRLVEEQIQRNFRIPNPKT